MEEMRKERKITEKETQEMVNKKKKRKGKEKNK